MSQFDKLSQEAIRALSDSETSADKLIEKIGVATKNTTPSLPTNGMQLLHSSFVSQLESQYDLNLKTLKEDLSFTDKDDIPTLKEVSAAISESNAQWLTIRLNSSIVDELLVTPSIKEFGLQAHPTLFSRRRGLLPRFDRLQPNDRQTKNDEEDFIGVYDDRSEVHDCGKYGKWIVAFLLQDVYDPLRPNQPINASGEPGLAYTDENLPTQRQLFKQERTDALQHNHNIMPMSIGQFIMLNAIRRHAKQSRRSENTRLIHYKMEYSQYDHTNYCVPIVGVDKYDILHTGALAARWSATRDALVGVRRVLIIPTGVPYTTSNGKALDTALDEYMPVDALKDR